VKLAAALGLMVAVALAPGRLVFPEHAFDVGVGGRSAAN
jgi:hypothetical protein